MRNKYSAKKVVINGIKFASKREAEYYLRYNDMLNKGELVELHLQPKFLLQEKFRDKNGKMEREIKYTADFQLDYPDGRKVVVEVKGFKTTDYIIRRKLFKRKYRDEYDFEEVH